MDWCKKIEEINEMDLEFGQREANMFVDVFNHKIHEFGHIDVAEVINNPLLLGEKLKSYNELRNYTSFCYVWDGYISMTGVFYPAISKYEEPILVLHDLPIPKVLNSGLKDEMDFYEYVDEQKKKNKGKEMMVFDWDKAARIIKEVQPKCAIAGLREDYGFTSGTIYDKNDGIIMNYDDCYLSSIWAIPDLILCDEFHNSITIPCYRYQSEVPDWNEKTLWPDSARKILEGD